jgi:hypothetical protein
MHIVPLLVGEERAAMSLCERAIDRGVFAQAIRPPTVSAGTSRLRLAAMASHTPAELRMAARVLGEAARELGLEPAEIGTIALEREAPAGAPDIEEQAIAAAGTSRRLEGDAPFDIEQDLERPPATSFDFERDEHPAPVPAGEVLRSSHAPFDIERETAREVALARAA